MDSLGNKKIMAKNIKYYMGINGLSQNDICRALGFKAPTFSDWVNAKTYPRIDKIERMANYFGVSKSDLVEERLTPIPESEPKYPKNYDKLNDTNKAIVDRLIADLAKNQSKP